MYLEDLETELKGKNINFIAMAITPYHAIGISAAIGYLESTGVELNGYILMTSHPDTGRVLNSLHFNTGKQSIKCINFEYSFNEKKNIVQKAQIKLNQLLITRKNKRGNPLYFVWTEVLNNILYVIQQVYPNRDLVFIKIDDGAASYLSPFERRLSYLLYASGNNKARRIKSYAKAFGYSSITTICENGLQKKRQLINANVFIKTKSASKDALERNQLFSWYYNNAFKPIDVDYQICELFQDAIVINSQGLGEFKVTDGRVDFECFQKLATYLNSKYRVILKPHPREKELDKYYKLGWEVIKTDISQEVILARSRPKCIISFFSSTLLNAKGIFEVPVISLARILLDEEITSTFRNELERYIRMYTGVVLFPSNFEEINNTIDTL